MRFELLKHRKKRLRLTRLPEQELIELEDLVTQNITFINEALIGQAMFLSAEQLVNDIDPSDTIFVALTKHLKAKLWTGDKVLLEGLQEKRYKSLITTPELLLLFEELEKQ